ncbi:hypothetical protein MKX01_001324, partial [Papaver californicum]
SSPSIRAYYEFFSILKTGEEVFELLGKIKETGWHTFIMLVREFCRWRLFENVFMLWNEMGKNGVIPDRSSYNACS